MAEPMDRLARMAAQFDAKEGGTRMGQNTLALIAWVGKFRLEHQDCGHLALETDMNGFATAAICPVHGRSEAPEWIPPPLSQPPGTTGS